MALQHQGTRRSRYRGRAHEVDTRPQVAAAAVVPETIAWKRPLGGPLVHAFSSGPGWMRSACRQERWTVTLVDEPEPTDARCPDCSLLVDGAPGEIAEAWGK